MKFTKTSWKLVKGAMIVARGKRDGSLYSFVNENSLNAVPSEISAKVLLTDKPSCFDEIMQIENKKEGERASEEHPEEPKQKAPEEPKQRTPVKPKLRMPEQGAPEQKLRTPKEHPEQELLKMTSMSLGNLTTWRQSPVLQRLSEGWNLHLQQVLKPEMTRKMEKTPYTSAMGVVSGKSTTEAKYAAVFEEGYFRLVKVHENSADIFTKSGPKEKLKICIASLGLST